MKRGHANIPKGVNGAYYPSELSLHKQLLLKAIIGVLGGEDPYTDAGYVYERYHELCEEWGEEPEDAAAIAAYLSYLKDEGYIFIKAVDGETQVSTEFPIAS